MSEPQSPPSAALVSTAPEDRTPTFLDLLLVLVRRRRLIVLTTVIVAFVLLAYNIAAKFIDPESPLNVLPDRYTATVTVLVRGDQQDYGAAAASLLSQIPSGGLADFTSLLAAGTNTDANLAQELLIGRTILDELAAHQGFITPLSQPDEKFQARRRLEQNLSVDYRPGSGVLEIAYEHIDPQQAFAGLFFTVSLLRNRVHMLTMERIIRRKEFLEERLVAVGQDRTDAQDELIAFQQQFGVVNLTAQSEYAIENLTILKTELYRKEVELHSQMELLGEDHASVKRMRSEVDKMRTLIREVEYGFVEFPESAIPLNELPALGVRYLDLATELSVHNTIYSFLRSQYESARIEESSQEASFQVVEPVEVPLKKSRPSRARICIFGTIAAFMASILAAFVLEYFGRAASDPVQRKRLAAIREEIGLRR